MTEEEEEVINNDWLICCLLNVSNILDCEGRPLGERKVPIEKRLSGVQFELTPCPYSGARALVQSQKQMNLSALKRLSSNLSEVFSIILILRNEYFHNLKKRNISFLNLWKLSMSINALPRYLIYSRDNMTQNGKLPTQIADAYKLSAGINQLMLELSLREIIGSNEIPIPEMNSEILAKEVDKMLVGENEVCAASPSMIVQALDAFIIGKVQTKVKAFSLTKFIQDFESYFEFATTFIDLKIFQILIRLLYECILYDFRENTQKNNLKPRTGYQKLPTFTAIRSILLESPFDFRSKFIMQIGERMVTQENPARDYFLQQLRECLDGMQYVTKDFFNEERSHFRFPNDNNSKNKSTLNATNKFELGVKYILNSLESNLRASLGYPILTTFPDVHVIKKIIF